MNPTYAQAMQLLNTVQPHLLDAIRDQLAGQPRAQAYAWTIELPETPEGDDGTVRPTVIMERISRFLEDNPQGMSKRSIRTAVAGSNDLIDLAIEFLLEAHIKVEKVGTSHLHVSVKPYRAA